MSITLRNMRVIGDLGLTFFRGTVGEGESQTGVGQGVCGKEVRKEAVSMDISFPKFGSGVKGRREV